MVKPTASPPTVSELVEAGVLGVAGSKLPLGALTGGGLCSAATICSEICGRPLRSTQFGLGL